MKKKENLSIAESTQHASNSSSSERLKRLIIKKRNVIRKKFHELHNKKLAVNEKISETYKPIIAPLENLVKHEKIKQERLQNDQISPTPKAERKQTPERGYMFMPDSVFKTAVAPHRSNHFQLTTHPPSSSSQSQNISGVFPLADAADDDDDDEDADEDGASTHKQSIIKKVRFSNSPDIDNLYGFRYKNGSLLLGKDAVLVATNPDGEMVYSIRRKEFPVTHGLTNLLLQKNPIKYNNRDLEIYKDMLTYTSAHKKNYTTGSEINREMNNVKYNSIIKDLFPRIKGSLRSAQKTGESLSKPQTTYKLASNRKSNYVYWNDPNELVDRLRLLMASQAAGHTGHDNEIISIIEELREAEIIE